MSYLYTAFIAAVLVVLTTNAPQIYAHEGHDHDAPVVASTQPEASRFEATSGGFELVGALQGNTLKLWLDRFETNEPVPNASIEVETPIGPEMAQPRPDGSFELQAHWAEKPGSYDLIFTVSADGETELLTARLQAFTPTNGKQLLPPPSQHSFDSSTLVGTGIAGIFIGAFASIGLRRRPLVWATAIGLMMLAAFGAFQLLAHDGHNHGDAPNIRFVATDRAQVLTDGSIFLPKSTQRVLALRTRLGREDQFMKRIQMPGRVIPDPNASGLVQAASTGRLAPPPGGFPRLGSQVKTGDVLAFVSTPFLAIDQSTMRQQQGDLDQQISIVDRRIARYETLAKTGAVAQVTLDEARLELQGLRDKRASLDLVKREPEALRAPVDGIVSSTNAVSGQVVDANTIIFQIIDPRHLLIEALSFETPTHNASASGRTSDGRELKLSFVGGGLADRNQALPVHYDVDDPNGTLRVGQFVTVYSETSKSMTGVAVPRASVVRQSNGESVVYTHDAAERFVARVVRTSALDADRVMIVAGLKSGTRIVTQSAEFLNQVR